MVALLSSDLDGTLVGDDRATRRFRAYWAAFDPESRPILVYNSGRLVEDIEALLKKSDLPRPDYLIGGVGTMVGGGLDHGSRQRFGETLGDPFDRAMLALLMGKIDGIRLQDEVFQHAHKSSWHLHDASDDDIVALEARLIDAGLDARLVYSSSRDLDVLPRTASKGSALSWLCGELGIDLSDVVVAGDTGNDCDMFLIPDVRGIVVGNALEELRRLARSDPRHYQARQAHADGVIEGMDHHGSLSAGGK